MDLLYAEKIAIQDPPLDRHKDSQRFTYSSFFALDLHILFSYFIACAAFAEKRIPANLHRSFSGRRSQVAKAEVCKTFIHRFKSDRRLHFLSCRAGKKAHIRSAKSQINFKHESLTKRFEH
jgi:hypothetical protein